MDLDVAAFVAEVGTDGPVTITGAGTRGRRGAGRAHGRAPAGIDWFRPDEMTVSCGAGTPVVELDEALARARPGGGDPAVGHGRRRAGGGPQRDPPSRLRPGPRHAAAGALRVGGWRAGEGRRPDGEERQRLRSVPPARRVPRHDRVPRRRDPAHPAACAVRAVVQHRRPIRSRRCHACTARHRCCGTARTTFVLLEGDVRDVEAAAARLELDAVADAPLLPRGGRWSIAPSDDPLVARHVRRRSRRRHRAPQRTRTAADDRIRRSSS